MVAINESALLSIGGYGTADGETFLYDAASNSWSQGPKQMIPSFSHSCAVVNWNNPATNQPEGVVVVAGGFSISSSSAILSRVELLRFGDLSKGWHLGPELPKKTSGSVLVEHNSGVILVGGYGQDSDQDNQLFRLESPEGPWLELKQRVLDPKYDHIAFLFFKQLLDDIAFLIPDELTNCHH